MSKLAIVSSDTIAVAGTLVASAAAFLPPSHTYKYRSPDAADKQYRPSRVNASVVMLSACPVNVYVQVANDQTLVLTCPLGIAAYLDRFQGIRTKHGNFMRRQSNHGSIRTSRHGRHVGYIGQFLGSIQYRFSDPIMKLDHTINRSFYILHHRLITMTMFTKHVEIIMSRDILQVTRHVPSRSRTSLAFHRVVVP